MNKAFILQKKEEEENKESIENAISLRKCG